MKSVLAVLLAVFIVFSSAVSQTKDTWRSVRTNHLFVIGNGDADKLRQVATWLEFFHSAFARLVSRNVIDSSVPTTVVIFRDDASFIPFKPRYQGRPLNVAGYFHPGNDVNYIVLSLDPTGRDPFSTAFHEYVYLHLRDNVPGAPLWLNEGLAELYGSLQLTGNDALLGAPLGYIYLLRTQELLPLKTLFSVGFNSPHYNEQEKAGIFYGESWALVHYLMLGERGRQEQFKRFLQLVSRGDDVTKAVENAFGMSLEMLEEDFRNYVRHGNLTAQRIGGVDPQSYTAYTAMQRSSLTDEEANYYLGDLLLRQGRYAEAKEYISSSPKLAAESRRSAAAAQPVKTAASSMVVTGTGSVAINDGASIDSSRSLPAVDELVKKYVEVIGGAAAINAVKSRIVKGTLDVVGVSRGGTFETYTLAPDKALTILQAHPIGNIKAGYNGRIGWSQTKDGVRLLKGAELASIQNDADFYGILNLKKSYPKITLQGKSKIGYREVYVIDLQLAGGPADRLYLDAASYLPVRMNSRRMQANVSTPVEIYFDDWREVDGIKIPYVMTLSYDKVTLILTVKEIQNNVPVDAKIFDRPL